jgi:hypothetical protein
MKVVPFHFWPYSRHARPHVGDVIPVSLRGQKVLAQVRFWNRFGIWLRHRGNGAFLWLSFRALDGDLAPEFGYTAYW